MRGSRRYQLRLQVSLAHDLDSFAERHGLGSAAAVRVLIRKGLNVAGGSEEAADSTAALAALVAAEHSLLMVASVLPEGQRRMRELAPHAAVAAEARLAALREAQA